MRSAGIRHEVRESCNSRSRGIYIVSDALNQISNFETDSRSDAPSSLVCRRQEIRKNRMVLLGQVFILRF